MDSFTLPSQYTRLLTFLYTVHIFQTLYLMQKNNIYLIFKMSVYIIFFFLDFLYFIYFVLFFNLSCFFLHIKSETCLMDLNQSYMYSDLQTTICFSSLSLSLFRFPLIIYCIHMWRESVVYKILLDWLFLLFLFHIIFFFCTFFILLHVTYSAGQKCKRTSVFKIFMGKKKWNIKIFGIFLKLNCVKR